MFEGKKIAIWGMGKEGQSLLKYCNNNGLQATVFEGKDIDLSGYDVLLKSPGISLYNDSLHKALEQGIELWSSTNIFLHEKDNAMKTIAVTGTKGKSTTSSLLAHILRSFGYSVGFGGNIGQPLIDLIGQKYDFLVAELSSYQCADLMYPFDISVVVNLYPEHIDWHQTHDRYYEDKLRLIRIRDSGQKAVLNWENTETLVRTKGEKDVIFFNNPTGFHLQNGWVMDAQNPLFKMEEISNLKGVHNFENICAVLTVLKELGLSLDNVKTYIQSFEPLAHRLQTVKMVQGVRFVDDSISTTPETSLAALKAFASASHIYLLVGGYDRHQDYGVLLSYVFENKDKITLVTMPITGSQIAAQADSMGLDVINAGSVADAVHLAQDRASSEDVILLSPGAPSYHAYKNFEARGEDFKANIWD